MWPGLEELRSLSKKVEAEKNGESHQNINGYYGPKDGATKPRNLTTVNPLHPTNLVLPEISN